MYINSRLKKYRSVHYHLTSKSIRESSNLVGCYIYADFFCQVFLQGIGNLIPQKTNTDISQIQNAYQKAQRGSVGHQELKTDIRCNNYIYFIKVILLSCNLYNI